MSALRNIVVKTSPPASDEPSSKEEGTPKLVAAAPGKPGKLESRFADAAFRSLVIACGLSVLAIVGLIVYELLTRSGLSIHKFGFKFLTTSIWDPVAEQFGALPAIYGTVVSSLLAVALAVPLSLGTALFITEICPRRLRGMLSLAVEMLAAIPSVIYGLWGIFVLAPLLRFY